MTLEAHPAHIDGRRRMVRIVLASVVESIAVEASIIAIVQTARFAVRALRRTR